jgi:hypothetical protein
MHIEGGAGLVDNVDRGNFCIAIRRRQGPGYPNAGRSLLREQASA